MRKDIEINIETGDVTLGVVAKEVKYPFAWLSTPEGEDALYGEVVIPQAMSLDGAVERGVACDIPYIGKAKPINVRIRKDGTENETGWYTIKTADGKDIPASSLRAISRRGFTLIPDGVMCRLYAFGTTDFNIVDANHQNTDLLLACVPTNSYRYPTSGVGLIRWKNSHMSGTGLSDTLKREFEADGVTISFASYDFETHGLDLTIDTPID